MGQFPSINANDVASGRNPSSTPVSGRAAAIWETIRTAPPRLIALVAGLTLLVWAYWPNLQDLYGTWMDEPNYSHGILVIPISLAIFWQRLKETKSDWAADPLRWWTWIPLLVTLAVRMFAYEHNSQWSETATLIPAVASLILALGGWTLLKLTWPAVAFLIFMLPLPSTANSMIAMPLQRLAAAGSVFIMQLTGLWTIADSNIIMLRDHNHALRTLEVAQACNGLSMLMTLAATVIATIILFPLANWKRAVILASAIPIALLSNIVRIVATGWCYYFIDGEKAHKLAHDLTGIFLMMPLALILVGLELLLLSWLADDRHDTAATSLDRPLLAILPREAR